MAVDGASDDPLGQPFGGDMRRTGIVGANPRGIFLERVPESADILPEFADDEVTAVETEIEQAIGRAARLQPAGRRLVLGGHNRTRRLLVMRVGMADENLAKRDTVPFVFFNP